MRYRDLTGVDYDCEDCIHNDKEWDELRVIPAVMRTAAMSRENRRTENERTR